MPHRISQLEPGVALVGQSAASSFMDSGRGGRPPDQPRNIRGISPPPLQGPRASKEKLQALLLQAIPGWQNVIGPPHRHGRCCRGSLHEVPLPPMKTGVDHPEGVARIGGLNDGEGIGARRLQ